MDVDLLITALLFHVSRNWQAEIHCHADGCEDGSRKNGNDDVMIERENQLELIKRSEHIYKHMHDNNQYTSVDIVHRTSVLLSDTCSAPTSVKARVKKGTMAGLYLHKTLQKNYVGSAGLPDVR